MTINTNSLIQESTLNRMVQLAFRGQNNDPDLLNSALGVLNKCGLNAEQNAKIAAILGNVPSDSASQATTEMKEKILAVLKNPAEPMCFSGQSIEILDISEKIFIQCLSGGDIVGLQALACTSVKLYENLTSLVGGIDLKLCSGLTILDAKTQGITVDDEPLISKLTILKYFRDLAPQVENNEGMTLLTMAKGLTLRQLYAIAEEAGIELRTLGAAHIRQGLRDILDVAIEDTYVILITNTVFRASRNTNYTLANEFVAGKACGLPTIQEYVALCVFTSKVFQKCVYGKNPSLENDGAESTIAMSSTCLTETFQKFVPSPVGGFIIRGVCHDRVTSERISSCIGIMGSTPTVFYLFPLPVDVSGNKNTGAGGRVMFQSIS